MASKTNGSTGETFFLVESLFKGAARSAESEPNYGLVKLRQLAEIVSREIAQSSGISLEEVDGQANLITLLYDRKKISHSLKEALHRIRKDGNRAVHENFDSIEALDARLVDAALLIFYQYGKTMLSPDGRPIAFDDDDDQNEDSDPSNADVSASSGMEIVPVESTQVAADEELDDVDFTAPEGWPDDAVIVLRAQYLAQKSFDRVNMDVSLLEEAENTFREEMESALAPFCMGVVGEFRSGKSTLINALLGENLALTGVTETTAAMSSFGYGDVKEAMFVYRDETNESFSIEEANKLLDERRSDSEWLEKIKEIRFRSSTVSDSELEIWDGPGLGGNDFNEEVANLFITRISAAIWVLDAELLGNATLLEPIRRLQKAGKPVLAVLNRIDALDLDTVEEAVEFVQDSYPDMFTKVIPFSALDAVKARKEGRDYPALDALQKTITNNLRDTATDTRKQRIEQAVVQGAKQTYEVIINVARPLEDKFGLLAHIRLSTEEAVSKIKKRLPVLIDEKAEKLLQDREEFLLAETNRLITENSESLNAGRPTKKLMNSTKQILAALDDEASATRAWKLLVKQVQDEVELEWQETMQSEIDITRAAIPEILERPVSMRPKDNMLKGNDDSAEVGLVTGAASGIALGALAAATVAVTWPIIIAALPLGGTAAFFQKRNNMQKLLKQISASLSTLPDQIKDTFSKQRQYVKQEAMVSLAPNLESFLQHNADTEIEKIEKELFAPHNREIYLNVRTRTNNVLSKLTLSFPNFGFPNGNATIRVPKGADGITKLKRMLSRDTYSLDLRLSEFSNSAVHLFSSVPLDVRIRLLFSVSKAQEEALKLWCDRVFGLWQGTLSIKNIHTENGAGLQLKPMMISDSGAWFFSADPGEVERNGLIMSPHVHGRLAAQREYGSLWSGIPTGHSSQSLVVTNIR